MLLPFAVLGFAPAAIYAYLTFVSLHAVFIHANFAPRAGWLERLLVMPHFHHWHHAALPRTLHNFSNLAPWTDVLFGTYHCPPRQDHVLGMPGFPVKSYLGWILRPHLDERRCAKSSQFHGGTSRSAARELER